MEFTHALAQDLAQQGCVVISGGAHGIDAAAHQGALSVEGHTVAVLATGFKRAYPSRHSALFRRILDHQGTLICEYDDDLPRQSWHFLARNRLIAAMANAVVVVQAPFKSGAWTTAAHAKRLHRPLLVVPAAPWDPRGNGSLSWLQQGARLCVSAQEVMKALPIAPQSLALQKRSTSSTMSTEAEIPAELHGDAQSLKLWQLLSAEARDPDTLAALSGFPIARVHQILVTLCVHGHIAEVPGGRYVRTASYPNAPP